MGTVRKIIDNLQKLCDDKRAQADRRYEDHSAWLSSEFVQIHRLIQGMNIEPDAIVEEAPSRMREDPPMSKSQKRKSPETSQHGSRNSPQSKRTATSPTFEDVAKETGLPTDLNRLTKEQLLSELQKRGCVTMTMKALKRDLVDALKELVVDIASRECSPVEPEPAVEPRQQQEEATASFEPLPVVDLASASPRDPARKGSNSKMADIRSRVVGSNVPVQETGKSVAAAEFEARQRRHRKSQEIRTRTDSDSSAQSVSIMPPPAPAEMLVSPVPKKESVTSTPSGSAQKLAFLPVTMPALMTSASPAPKATVKSTSEDMETDVFDEPAESAAATDLVDEPVESAAETDVIDEPVESAAETDVVDEPVESAEETEEVDEKPTCEPMECEQSPSKKCAASVAFEQEDSDLDESFHSAVGSPAMGEIRAEEESEIAVQEEHKEHPPHRPTDHSHDDDEERELSLEELSPALKESPVEVITVKSAPDPQPDPTTVKNIVRGAEAVGVFENKKPSNLMSGNGTTSFFSASSVTTVPKAKPVVPALQQAARLKEKEEARLAAKKKELDEKKKLTHAPGPFSSTAVAAPAAPTSKSFISGIFGSKHAASKPVTSTSVVPPAPPLAKKALFGWNGAAKKEMPAAAPSSTGNPLHKPAVLGPAAVAAPSADENAPPNDAPKKTTTSSHPAPHPSTATSTPGILKEIPVKLVPVPEDAPPPAEAESVEYIIQDRDDSDSSDTDSEGGDKKPKQEIPEWAKGPQLKAALEKQYGFHGGIMVDPDVIFSEVHTCSLEEIFGKREGKCGKFSARTSSAHWEADKLSVVDKRKYRLQMGYDKN